jgi:hypothetical protein
MLPKQDVAHIESGCLGFNVPMIDQWTFWAFRHYGNRSSPSTICP